MTKAVPVIFEQDGTITIGTIAASRVLDALNVTEFGRAVTEFIQDKPGLHLLLDFENVSYLSSAVLSELIRINDLLKRDKGSLRLCGFEKNIEEVFRITNLDQVFVIDGTLGEAVKRFKRSLQHAAQEEAWLRQQRGEE